METNNTRDLSIVIPVYGSQEVLPNLVEKITAALNVTLVQGSSYEIIFICDNSPDKSWEVIKMLAQYDSRVRGILLRTNAGQHNALMAGFSSAQGRIIVTMDDDLQHNPEDILRLVQGIYRGADVVYARFKNRNHAYWKIVGSKLNNLVASYLLKKPRGLYLSPFRAFKSEICSEILSYRGPYVYVDGLILSATNKIQSIDVDHYDRFAGSSGYGLKKSLSLWLKMATSFSIVPLRLTSFLGIIISSLGFLLAILLVIQRFTLNLMPVGWSSIIVTLLIIGGFQLLALGVIGEYLGRVLLTINSRPQYVLEERVGFSEHIGHTSRTIK
jgi:undecaprenyl-phosphate 4-deoxy-4-formamido-L-arabinose transferase